MFGRRDPVGPYLRREVQAFSPYWRAAGVDQPPPRALADFAPHAADLVLRPDLASVYSAGPRRLAARTMWSRLWGRQQRVNDRLLVPRYKPVLWTVAGGVPIGYSSADEQRLGRLGAAWLAAARVVRADVLVSVLPPGPDLAWWFVRTAARTARLSALHLGPGATAADVAALQPTVLAGAPMDLLRLLEAAPAALTPRLLLAVGTPIDDGLRARLRAAAGGAPVVNAWAPPGVRALWTECIGGAEWGLHLAPDTEQVELLDPLSGVPVPPGAGGEVVWSPIGWRGTVMLRLRTGVFATVETSQCLACGRIVPRLLPAARTPAFLAALDRHAGVAGWQAELRTVDGAEELIVFLALSPEADADADAAATVRALDADLSATQYVVLDRAALDARLAAHGDARVVDLRPS